MSSKADKAKYAKMKRQSCLQKIKTISFVQIELKKKRERNRASGGASSLPQSFLNFFPELATIGLLQQTITWYMVVGKLIIIPAPGHSNKETWTSEAWLAFVLMSQCGNNNEFAHHHVPCDRLLEKVYFTHSYQLRTWKRLV